MAPHERSLVQRLEKKPFALLGVNGDDGDDAASLKAKNEELKISWRSFKNAPNAKDGASATPPISEQWNIRGWPTLFLIDHEGIIRAKWLGSPGDQVIDKAIDELVAKAEAAAKEKKK